MRQSIKVLVVGGGPAGAIAAGTLADSGVETILLERNPAFKKPCGGGIPLSAFDELSISPAGIKKEVNRISIISPSGEKLDIGLKFGKLAIVERGDFDRLLRREAERKGATVIHGEFIAITRDRKRRYEVEARVGTERFAIFAEYIVAADGINSSVRRTLGMKPPAALFTMSERLADLHCEACEFWFGSYRAPGFYSWVFPSADGISVGTGNPEARKVRTLLETFKLERGITQQGNKRVYKIPLWQGNLYHWGRILFAGDSAGQVLPLTFEGIYYAMKAGELAAKAVIEGKVRNYRKLWKARFEKRFVLMDRLRRYFLKDDASIEKLVALHRRPEVVKASERLWLCKDSGKESLFEYLKIFGKIIR
ncbi:MAG: NAD(P)/FAD-dependent oxidoreductase [Nitrospirota bacterium]